MRTALTAIVFALITAGTSTTLLADVISPTEEACSNLAAGDTCTVNGTSGTCQDDTCSRLDYSNGTPPETVEYDCLVCSQDTPGEDTSTGAETSEETSPPTSDNEDEGGCSVGGLSSSGLPLWSLLIGAGLAGALIVMRKRT